MLMDEDCLKGEAGFEQVLEVFENPEPLDLMELFNLFESGSLISVKFPSSVRLAF